MIKKVIRILSLLFFSSAVFGQPPVVRQQKLSAENSSWTSVISGAALCQPKKTSYGFAVLTDGKMISACSENGTKLWEKGVHGHPDPFLTVFSSDFLLTVSDSKNLSLINPSGLTLWTVKVPFSITNDPVVGRDSRIIVKGNKGLACYGVNGVCKWTLETPALKKTPVLELNDGTMMCLLESLKDGKSSAIRFTPFGEIVENINFTGVIQSAVSCPDGVLLSFNGGGAGMCAVQENTTSTKWSIPYSDRAFSNTNPSSGSDFLDLTGRRAALVIAGSGNVKTRVLIFSTIDGRVSDWFNVDFYYNDIACKAITTNADSLFFCDKNQSSVYDTTGNLLWNALLPPPGDLFNKWNFVTFTKGNYLVICSKSWAMAGFRTTYKLTKKNQIKQKKLDYSNFYNIDTSYFEVFNFLETFDEKYTGNNRQKTLKAGGYGIKEVEYSNALFSVYSAYNSYLMQSFSGARPDEKSLFARDKTGLQEILCQFSLFGTDDYAGMLANIIRLETDETNLQLVLRSAALFGYDPQGSILKAIGIKTKKMESNKTTDLILVCDAVYEICRFMGRPALYSYGMEILSQLLYPQYDSKVRDYARNTLTKIAGLKI